MKILNKKQLQEILRHPFNKSKSYTYVLFRNDLTPFYVGVGQKYRVFAHFRDHEIKNGTNRMKINTILKEQRLGEVFFGLVVINKNREVCLEEERKFISKFERIDIHNGLLTNLTDGGDIGPTGFIVPESTKELKSNLNLARRDEFVEIGKKQWADYSEEMKTGVVSNMTAGRQTEEYKAKQSILIKERWSDPEYRERLSQAHLKAWAKRKAAKAL